MRFKYYLRGAGFGILVTSIIFTIAIHASGRVAQEEVAPIETLEESEAGATGDENINKHVSVEDGQLVVKTEETKVASEPGTEGSATDVQEEVPPEITPREGYVIVRIEKGEVARTLAEELQEKGIVSDSEDFRKYMGTVGYDHRMSVGTYEIPEGASYDEIISILSN